VSQPTGSFDEREENANMPVSWFQRERSSFANLLKTIRERAASEEQIATTFQATADEVEKEVQRSRRQIATSRKKARNELDEKYQQEAADFSAKYAGRQNAAERRRAEALRLADETFEDADEKTQTTFKDRLWTIDSLVEAAEKEAQDHNQKLIRQVELGRKKLETTWQKAQPFLDRVGLERADVEFPPDRLPSPTQTDAEGKLQKCLEDCDASSANVGTCTFPKLLGIGGAMALTILAGAIGFGIGWSVGKEMKTGVIGGVAGAILGGLLLRYIVLTLARHQVRDRANALGVYQAEAFRAATTLDDYAQAMLARQRSELKRRHANDKKRTDDHFLPLILSIERQRDGDHDRIETEYVDRLQLIANDRDLETRAAEDRYQTTAGQLEDGFDAQLQDAENRYAGKMQTATAARDATWDAMARRWQKNINAISTDLSDVRDSGLAAFPRWAELMLPNRPPITHVPPGIRFGKWNVDQYAIADGEPGDERLMPDNPVRMKLPAFLPFPDKCAVLWKAADRGRAAAVNSMQAVMLRFLTGLPPGKVRFTILDPVGLGENFAAFMSLADYDENLVGARIWTEPSQIEQRLVDLTEHMENVIQKYLRNQYKSIEDYNAAAGEVAEPYRVLVVANFPTNFTPDTARRLISIMSSGPACGVCTLVSVDTKAGLPRDFRLADLEQVAFNLVEKDGKFVPLEPELAVFPLTLDTPPDGATVAATIRRIGEASRTAARVEVPFDFIMPNKDAIWTGNTAKGFDIPIGRAGATKRQMLMLGRGTAQHALIAGKTGSGKSTLLHAMITNLALIYSPDEAELYLIDFKKGVEFRAYATSLLPHARVIAIESEREFGLSVLQRLDSELRDRGDRFRAAGANDLGGYRDYLKSIGSTLAVPRILFIVDEFQEFFVEDDKLSQESALLLDRLVRQGRAFGLHVLLGSQTLGGAYSLARSTIDQMAVRIALQCSDADAQLILSKDNNAARLLSRPGEAIYNDANGLVEGNDPFQVVWLDEDRRETLLTDIRNRANGKYPPPLVFEGNIAAEVQNNRLLAEALKTKVEVRVPVAWFGDAVAIKDPTSAAFRMQSGANVLMIGQQEESALALMATAMASLAAQVHVPDLFTVLDGTPDDSDHADYLRKVAASLGYPDASIDRAGMANALAALAQEIERRQQGVSAERVPRFLFVQGLHRFRELRKADDDFGYGRKSDQPKAAGELLATILKDGPTVGIHAIVWCDSLTNLTRALERQALKEFSQRVLFQMSATDSSTLIDTPAASRLGRTRALFVQEDLERPEKFRPYGLPDMKWLREIGAEIHSVDPVSSVL